MSDQNEILNIGDKVRYTPVRNGPHDGKIYTIQRFLTASHGEPVVFLHGKSGYVARWAIFPIHREEP